MENPGIIPVVLTAMGAVAAVLLGVWGIVARYDDRSETGWRRSATGSTPKGRRPPSSWDSSGSEWRSSKGSSKDCAKH